VDEVLLFSADVDKGVSGHIDLGEHAARTGILRCPFGSGCETVAEYHYNCLRCGRRWIKLFYLELDYCWLGSPETAEQGP